MRAFIYDGCRYLNSLSEECGGSTVFPSANTSDTPGRKSAPLLIAERLTAAGHTHTLKCNNADVRELEEASIAVEAGRAPDGVGLAIRPERGKLVMFFSRHDDGSIDAASWHGGSDVVAEGKFTLQKFKEIPPEHCSSVDAMQRFVRSVRESVRMGIRRGDVS